MDSDTNNSAKDTEEDKEKRRDALWRRSNNAFSLLFLLSALLGLFSGEFSTTGTWLNGWGSRISLTMIHALVALYALSIPLIDYFCGITILSYSTIGALLLVVLNVWLLIMTFGVAL